MCKDKKSNSSGNKNKNGKRINEGYRPSPKTYKGYKPKKTTGKLKAPKGGSGESKKKD